MQGLDEWPRITESVCARPRPRPARLPLAFCIPASTCRLVQALSQHAANRVPRAPPAAKSRLLGGRWSGPELAKENALCKSKPQSSTTTQQARAGPERLAWGLALDTPCDTRVCRLQTTQAPQLCRCLAGGRAALRSAVRPERSPLGDAAGIFRAPTCAWASGWHQTAGVTALGAGGSWPSCSCRARGWTWARTLCTAPA